MLLQKDTPAPDFELHATPDQKLKLSDLRGKRVVLAFYPADWSPVCSDQMALYNEMLRYFHKHHAEVIGISVDSKWCHMAFSQNRKLHFPLLADFEPKGAVSRAYGAYNETKANPGEPCLYWMKPALSAGAIFLQTESILAQTAYWKHSKAWNLSTLKHCICLNSNPLFRKGISKRETCRQKLH